MAKGARVRLPDHRRRRTAPAEREFRGKDYADGRAVVSRRAGRRSLLGDLAISAGRARAQAREFGHSTEDELRILMLHGVLHLLGMDHETDRGRMARAENALARANWGCPTA